MILTSKKQTFNCAKVMIDKKKEHQTSEEDNKSVIEKDRELDAMQIK